MDKTRSATGFWDVKETKETKGDGDGSGGAGVAGSGAAVESKAAPARSVPETELVVLQARPYTVRDLQYNARDIKVTTVTLGSLLSLLSDCGSLRV